MMTTRYKSGASPFRWAIPFSRNKAPVNRSGLTDSLNQETFAREAGNEKEAPNVPASSMATILAIESRGLAHGSMGTARLGNLD